MRNVVVVTGGRDLDDKDLVYGTLDFVHKTAPITLLVEGGANGADRLSYEWAHAHGVPHARRDARWGELGFSAGPVRNQEMLDIFEPDIAVVFPGGDGTADMFERILDAGIVHIKAHKDEG